MKKLILGSTLAYSLLLPNVTFGLAVDSLPANKIEAAKKENADDAPLQQPIYPFKSGKLISSNNITGKPYTFWMDSEDGKTLDLKYEQHSSYQARIDASDVTSWESQFVGQSSNSGTVATLAVTGALIFWPMLLAAPLAARTIKTQSYKISYIDEYGSDQIINFVSTDSPRPLISLLRFSTQLEPRKQMPEDIAAKKYAERMPKLVAKLDVERKPLVKENLKKPWCSTADFTAKSPELEKYQATLNDLNQVRSKLKLPKFEDSNKLSSEEKWNTYLKNNPGISSWSKAYPKQADALRSCS